MIGKPLQRAADRSSVHHTGPETGDGIRQVERGERFRLAASDPAESGADAARHHQQARTELVDQPSFERHQPGLEKHEDRERHLDGGLLRVQVLLQRRDEQGPAVLEVRYGHHAENAEEEDQPAVLQQAVVLLGRLGVHGSSRGFVGAVPHPARQTHAFQVRRTSLAT